MNYQKELDKIIEGLEETPKLLLHSCCAPCSSYVLEYLSSFFQITIFFYNPNITEETEYRKRVEEQKRLIDALNRQESIKNPIAFLEGAYHKEDFFAIAKGLEQVKEGGERCFRCYELRLREAAKVAKEKDFDYYTTTLTISPLKNADKLNEIGRKLEEELQIPFLPSDFKKKNGYKRSVELSQEYGLYRQDYCGCIYSKMQREQMANAIQKEQGETK